MYSDGSGLFNILVYSHVSGLFSILAYIVGSVLYLTLVAFYRVTVLLYVLLVDILYISNWALAVGHRRCRCWIGFVTE